ncbi:hypothetical protein F8388_013866 [Cannabis sativa]|uniref:Inositol polyphosphate multikinase n=1 Tax=Cannabis sativa TaxID=3483 RepID=A0A7J6E925_CANSA|nr:hypothetical protein F8388_013866 [Cannabis sativa]
MEEHTMFQIPDHQVAGHKASKGIIGPLIDNSGRFYKPLQSNNRGSKEESFYKKFSSNTEIPNHIRKFFPTYYGTQHIEASDGSGQHPHLVLEDIKIKPNEDRSCVTIKLIDFAHVVDGQGVIDHNFLGGLCSLIKFVSEILDN